MSILEVIERDTIPTDLKERLEHNSDEVVAAALTQTFHYMIQCGLEYSYITTGETFVFLRIKEEDPTALYYHVTACCSDLIKNSTGGGVYGSRESDLGFCSRATRDIPYMPCLQCGISPRTEEPISSCTRRCEKYAPVGK